MKKIFGKIALLFTIAFALLACSKSDFLESNTEYEASMAEAYWLETSEDGRYDFYQLKLAAGSVDGDFNLVGIGGLVSIVICVPHNGEFEYPVGRYYVLADDVETYLETGTLIHYGEISRERIDEGVVSAKAQRDIRFENGICFDIEVDIKIAGRKYEFEYEGPLNTYVKRINATKR